MWSVDGSSSQMSHIPILSAGTALQWHSSCAVSSAECPVYFVTNSNRRFCMSIRTTSLSVVSFVGFLSYSRNSRPYERFFGRQSCRRCCLQIKTNLVHIISWQSVADSKGAVGAAAPPPYWLIFCFKKPLFPCKRHILRCAHWR